MPGQGSRVAARRERLAAIALWAILALGVRSSAVAGMWYAGLGGAPLRSDGVAAVLRGPDCVAAALPDVATVGYINRPDGAADVGAEPAARRYFLTQYALAPVIVRAGSRERWLVADQVGAGDGRAVARALGLEVIATCPGMTLLRRP